MERPDGRLEITGGHVDWRDGRTESYEEAALRELTEELALVENWRLTAEQSRERLRQGLIALGKFINQVPSSHGYNNEWVTAYRLAWRGDWGVVETFSLEVGTKNPRWLTLAQIVQMSLANPRGINSALRLFLARAGVLVSLIPPRSTQQD